jgi:hypothetical protein
MRISLHTLVGIISVELRQRYMIEDDKKGGEFDNLRNALARK